MFKINKSFINHRTAQAESCTPQMGRAYMLQEQMLTKEVEFILFFGIKKGTSGLIYEIVHF